MISKATYFHWHVNIVKICQELLFWQIKNHVPHLHAFYLVSLMTIGQFMELSKEGTVNMYNFRKRVAISYEITKRMSMKKWLPRELDWERWLGGWNRCSHPRHRNSTLLRCSPKQNSPKNVIVSHNSSKKGLLDKILH